MWPSKGASPPGVSHDHSGHGEPLVVDEARVDRENAHEEDAVSGGRRERYMMSRMRRMQYLVDGGREI